MKALSFLLFLCGVVVSSFLFASQAHAQATRTWVSGVGDDVNPCSRTAPCKTFAGAISKTADGGEINTLDSGGFGAVTITKSITISGDYVAAGVLVSGTNGITINGAGAVVTLRNLDIEGLGTGLSGIRFVQGAALHVENSTIRNFRAGSATGIEFVPSQPGVIAKLYVHNVSVSESGLGSTGGGIVIRPTAGGMASAFIDRARLENNTRGIVADGTDGTGPINVVFSNSTTVGATGAGVLVNTATTIIKMTLDAVTSARNVGQGLSVTGAGATVVVGKSSLVNNGVGVAVSGGATLQSFKNNQIGNNNTTDGTPITAVPGGPLN